MSIWSDRKYYPMLLKEIDKPFNSKDYLFEIKYDGIRVLLFVTPNKVTIQTRNKIDITNIYPELQSIKNLVKENTIFDGEIVYFNNGLPSFAHLQERNHLKNPTKIKTASLNNPIVFICFDIIYKSKDLTNIPLIKRKKLLTNYQDTNEFIKTSYILNNGIKLFKEVKKLGIEGIVAKKINSTYQINKRSNNWIKIKNLKQDTFYIGGFKPSPKTPSLSLYLGEYINNKLSFVGKVSLSNKHNLYPILLKEKPLTKSPFTNYNDSFTYIKPHYKCRITYLERTKNNHLRQPIYKGEA